MEIKKILKKEYIIYILTKFGFYNFMNDKRFIRKIFHSKFGYFPNLDDPKSFNEKLQWLKLYDRQEIYTKLVDKYEVKEIVKACIGEQYVIPTLGVWNSAKDIDYAKLPQQFVLKCTHDSGGVVIVKDKNKLDKNKVNRKLNSSLKKNYYYSSREWPYKNVKPRIIAEPYISDNNSELQDYKLMCFDGKVRCSFVCTDRYSKDGLKVTFYDREWNQMPFTRHYPAEKKPMNKPQNYEKMIELAESLSQNMKFVRIDLYNIKGKIFFGEYTFYPGAGWEEFSPEKWDYILGSWINL